MDDLAGLLYLPVLVAHSLWRWVVLVLVAAAVAAALSGRGARQAARLAVPAADLQLVLGLLLHLWLSPLGNRAIAAASRDAEEIFFAATHFAAMVIALGLTHAAGMSVRRGLERRGAALFGAALGLMLSAVPWWRPLLRL